MPAAWFNRFAQRRGGHNLRWLVGIVLVLTLAVALYFMTEGLGLWEGTLGAQVKPLVGEEQEIAWIDPATNTDVWAQLTAGLARLEVDWPQLEGAPGHLKVDMGKESSGAFPRLSAEVAEVALYFTEAPRRKLWLRWYKISGDNPVGMWIDKLRRRGRPPLAIAGGGSSDRAFALARALVQTRAAWQGKPPLLLITSATAEAERPAQLDTPGARLMDVYAGRTFRFCFANGAMVRAVLDFLHRTAYVWGEPAASGAGAAVAAAEPWTALTLVLASARHGLGGPVAPAAVGAVAAADPWTALALLFTSGHAAPRLYSVSWVDDSYSRDLAMLFREEYMRRHPFASQIDLGTLPYSVGDVYLPNAAEQTSVNLFLSLNPPPPRSILVLPAAMQRMRRYLAFLCQQAPHLARNLVVVNGDAITFNNIFRDRDFAWNVLDLPVPLVFFAHRNPVEANARINWSFAWQRSEHKARERSTSGTHDLLLYRDIIEAMLYAAFADGKLLGDADQVAQRLRQTTWHAAPRDAEPGDWHYNRIQNALVQRDHAGPLLFDEHGDRRPGTGEHIVWLHPNFRDDRLMALQPCTISIWRYWPGRHHAAWYEIDSQSPPYNQARTSDE